MRRRLFAAALTALLMMMTASVCAAQEALGEDGLYAETPALLRLRQETVSETAEDGVTLRRTYPSTANALVDAQMRADYIAYASSLAQLSEKDGAFASMEDEALASLYPGLMQSVTQVLHSTEEKTNSLLGRK